MMKWGIRIFFALLLSSYCHGAVEYLSPSKLQTDKAGKNLYIAESTARKIVIWDVASAKVRNTIALPEAPGGLTLSPDEKVLFVTGASPEGKLYFIDPANRKLSHTVSVGHTPGAVAVSPSGDTVYVCNRFDNDVSVISILARKETGRIPVLREPVSIVITSDGKNLFVGNSLPAGSATAESVSAAVSIIDVSAQQKIADVKLPNGATDLQGLCLSPDQQYLYVVHTLARYGVPATQLDRGWMNTSAISILDVGRKTLLDTIPLDNLNRGAANPYAVACTADGKFLCIAHAGTHEISVIDRPALHRKLDAKKASTSSSLEIAVADDLSFLLGLRQRIPLKGKGPRDVQLIGHTAYVAEYFNDSLGVVDVLSSTSVPARSFALGSKRELTAARRGEIMFHDANRCFQNWQSCASCHPGARADGLNWDLLNDGIGNPKNNRSLLHVDKRKPMMSLGAREDSSAAVHAGFKAIQFAQISDNENALVIEYLKQLKEVPSPYLENGRPSAAAQRGKKIFAAAKCGDCHTGKFYSDMKGYDLGFGTGPDKKKRFITAPLREAWRTAPYLYDGRAATMKEVFAEYNKQDTHGVTSNLTKEQLDDLVEFVLSL